MSESATTAEAPARGLPPGDEEPGILQRYGVVVLFLGPALVLLAVWIVYPTIRTILRSFFDRSGDEFVGLDNYQTLFSDDTLLTAIKNNVLWLLIVPAFVTAIGLVFAVLLERVRFSVAFKVAVFMPMAISLFAAGVIWRLMYEKDPDQGTVNAAVAVV
jgi:alpha-glucoside transport system permease protein